MKAMVLNKITSLDENKKPLEMVNLPDPVPKDNEILVKVSACGVCHTELDEIEGRTPPPRFPVVLGHEIVGRVEETGSKAINSKSGTGWESAGFFRPAGNVSSAFQAMKTCVKISGPRVGTPMEGMQSMRLFRKILHAKFRRCFPIAKQPPCCVRAPSATGPATT